jgi:hypothetical protein
VLRHGSPTLFALESATRTGLRIAFIYQSASWAAADELAARIVRNALAMLGAKRPDWYQGQPEYTQFGVLRILRENCIRCGRRLDDEKVGLALFCSDLCRAAHHDRVSQIMFREQRNAASRAYRNAKKSEKLAARTVRNMQRESNIVLEHELVPRMRPRKGSGAKTAMGKTGQSGPDRIGRSAAAGA